MLEGNHVSTARDHAYNVCIQNYNITTTHMHCTYSWFLWFAVLLKILELIEIIVGIDSLE